MRGSGRDMYILYPICYIYISCAQYINIRWNHFLIYIYWTQYVHILWNHFLQYTSRRAMPSNTDLAPIDLPIHQVVQCPATLDFDSILPIQLSIDQ